MAAAPTSSHPEVDGHLALEFDSCHLEAPGVVAGVAEETSRVEESREDEDVGLQGLEGLPAEAVAYIKSLQSKLADSQEVSFGCLVMFESGGFARGRDLMFMGYTVWLLIGRDFGTCVCRIAAGG
jgi:hypothetical protein